MARGGKEKGILDREESAARTMNGARILVRGEIKKAEQKEDTLTLILEQVTAEAGRRTAKFRRIVVYLSLIHIYHTGGSSSCTQV